MRRSASFKDILIDLIEEYRDKIEALDADYLEGGSARAEEKYDALHSGDLSLAMALTSNYKLMTIFQEIEEEMKKLSSRRSASETIRNLETRIARLENKSAGYPQGYFDSNMYDAERSYYEDDSKIFKDDYFGQEEETTPTQESYIELYDEVVDIMKILSSLHKLDTDGAVSKSFDKTFPKYVKFDPRRKTFKLSGGDDDRSQRVLQAGTLRDGYEDPFFKLTLDDASVDRKGDLRWTIGCHMMSMSGDVVSQYINKGDDYRSELKKWLDL